MIIKVRRIKCIQLARHSPKMMNVIRILCPAQSLIDSSSSSDKPNHINTFFFFIVWKSWQKTLGVINGAAHDSRRGGREGEGALDGES